MSPPSGDVPSAVIFGCGGPELTRDEAAFFTEANPLGFILFARNCQSPDQVIRLVDALRNTVARPDAPVLIDQEGGSVRRLRPPHWEDVPAAARFGALHRSDPERARAAAEQTGRLIAAQLAPLGISVACAPVLDISHPHTTAAIGDRAYAADPAVVVELARAFCDGVLAGGVLPVIKHMPGHGRATVDSHHEIPRVREDVQTLRETDFVPFEALASMPLAMTAHVVFEAVDSDAVATLSPTLISDIMRGEIGFDGLLMTDDIGMGALSGDIAERCQTALAAGCDAALHCSGEFDEMDAVAAEIPALSEHAWRRWQAAAARRTPARATGSSKNLAAQIAALLGDTR